MWACFEASSLTTVICHVLHIKYPSTTLDEAIKNFRPAILILQFNKTNLRPTIKALLKPSSNPGGIITILSPSHFVLHVYRKYSVMSLRGVTTLINTVLGEQEIFAGNLKKLLGIGRLKKCTGKLVIIYLGIAKNIGNISHNFEKNRDNAQNLHFYHFTVLSYKLIGQKYCNKTDYFYWIVTEPFLVIKTLFKYM